MRIIMIIFLMLIETNLYARVLHIGDKTIPLSQGKTTSPALHIKINDEIWHANLCTKFHTDTLHIQYNGTTYSVIKSLADIGNYTYDEAGHLIAANENLFLQASGTQYIDTGHIPTLVTRTEMEVRFSTAGYNQYGTSVFFGVYDFANAKSSYGLNFGADIPLYNVYPWLCAFRDDGGPLWCSSVGAILITEEERTTKQTVILDAKNHYAQYGTKKKILHERQTTENESALLFGANFTNRHGTSAPRPYSKYDAMYIYSTRIYEDDTLVRHFVPVPCGLQIGDFVVPSNGMWDIVEQKFYGNMGTGNFTYGMDE